LTAGNGQHGALAGLRVVDFGQYIAAPLAAVMLADQGADVIHVDPPGGPRWQSAADAFYNRGKRRITLDLKRRTGRQTAQALIDRADVVLENFRPGVIDRLGVGPDEMMARNPGLIYCSTPGFAADDPRAGLPGWEGVVATATGTYRSPTDVLDQRYAGELSVDPSRPAYTPLPLASNFAAFHAATAIAIALVARNRMGRGQRIEVPLFDAMFELFGYYCIWVDGKDAPREHGSWGGGPYECADGRWVYLASGNFRFIKGATDAGGFTDRMRAEGLIDPARLLVDTALEQKLRARLKEMFLTRPSTEWEETVNRNGAPLSIIRTPAEWIAHPHARASQTVVRLDDPELGPTWMPGLANWLTESPPRVAGPRHRPDEDRGSILAEAGAPLVLRAFPSPEPALPFPLHGISVLDLTQVVAGPTTGRILADYGADVVKINNPDRPDVPQHLHANRGKRSLLLDIQSKAGMDAFWRLVERSDIVMQNFPLGTAERYGIGYEQVMARRPDVLYYSVSAYGYHGPRGGHRGYETMAQSTTGIIERFSGDGPPIRQPYLLDDYGTGVIGAFSIALGIYHKQLTGRAQHMQNSLAQCATYHQGPFLQAYEGKVWDEPRGPLSLGEGPLFRLYKASDGWFFLASVPGDRSDLSKVKELDGVLALPGDKLEQGLEQCFASAPRAVWVKRLQEAGVGAHAGVTAMELMSDPWVIAHELSVTQPTPGVGYVTMPGRSARLSRTPMGVAGPSHVEGSDGLAVLQEIGMGDRGDQMLKDGDLRVPEHPYPRPRFQPM
jgi:crotonobetainyl-CoA:carnitine CoA-transferase CaiB-like acyl-CoA transferase